MKLSNLSLRGSVPATAAIPELSMGLLRRPEYGTPRNDSSILRKRVARDDVFFIAFLGRSLSGYLFTKHYEPKLEIKEGYYFSFFDFFKKMPKNNFGRFTIFSSLVTFATAIASPFFAVYMLRELGFSYFEFTLIIISSIFANFIFQPFWGKFADKFGNINVIKLCGFFIFLVPLLWFVSPLIFIQSKSFLILYLFLV